jgi:hypothetical protein
MKRRNKYLILILIFISAFYLSACKNIRLDTFKDSDDINKKIEEDKDIKPESSEDDTKEKADNKDNKDDEDTPTPTAIQPIKNMELLIYVVNSSTEQLDPVTALVPADTEITPKLVVDTVVDSMADQSLLIGIENVSTQDDTVIISFYSDKAPLSNVGSGLEVAILDAIAQSVTENLDDYNKVIYRVEGGPYMSGHIELEADEVYFEDPR